MNELYIFMLICWGFTGPLVLLTDKKVSRVSYFLCWLCLMAMLASNVTN